MVFFSINKRVVKLFSFYLLASLITLAVCVVIAEIALRVFDPLPVAISGNKVNFHPNTVVTLQNNHRPSKLDDKITVSFNEVGLRGDAVREFKQADVRILLIGGSTTQCIYLSDGFTWGDRLKEQLSSLLPGKKISVINAGLDGHSTFGHVKLLEIYASVFRALSPTHVFLMAGINDFSINQARHWDTDAFVDVSDQGIWHRLYIYQYYKNIKNLDKKYSFLFPFGTRELVIDKKMELSEKEYRVRYASYYQNEQGQQHDVRGDVYQEGGYNQRLARIVKLIQQINHPKIIFVTQAALYGPGIDPTTGVDLGKWNLGRWAGDGCDFGCWSGDTRWAALQQYNDAMRVLGQSGIAVFDLANQLPKDSRYFYDEIHFTNEGANKVGEILAHDFYAQWQ